MAKKDFSIANAGPVYTTIEAATADNSVPVEQTRKERRTYDAAEAQEALENRTTQGRKGLRLRRINMAFSDQIYDYVKIMSTARGQTLTDFVNDILEQSLEKNRDVYERALEFLNDLKRL